MLQDQGLQPLQINEYCKSNWGGEIMEDEIRIEKFSVKTYSASP